MDDQKRNTLVAYGLITIGALLLTLRLLLGYGESITLLTVSSGFLAAYLLWQKYAMLVIAGITFGASLSTLASKWGLSPLDSSQVTLGIGLLSIFFIDRLFRRDAPIWPLIPGVILLALGLAPDVHWTHTIQSYGWPIVLMCAGAWMLVRK